MSDEAIYNRLFHCVIIQAIKDYKGKSNKHKQEIKQWVENMEGTFIICAQSLDQSPYKLQELMYQTMNQIDRKQWRVRQ